jgi:hypothetical protein
MTPFATPAIPAQTTKKTNAEVIQRIRVKNLSRAVASASAAALSSLVCLTISSITARCAE